MKKNKSDFYIIILERMNYINEDKNYKTQEEWIKYLEESIRELRKEKENLNKEKGRLKAENKKLKEFKEKREESKFYFKALVERVEPINSKEAEELQRYKKLFERLYREELYYLEKENKELKEKVETLELWLDNKEKVNKSLREEIQEWLNAV